MLCVALQTMFVINNAIYDIYILWNNSSSLDEAESDAESLRNSIPENVLESDVAEKERYERCPRGQRYCTGRGRK